MLLAEAEIHEGIAMTNGSVGAPLPAGSTIGIFGGGQLARMLSMAAARLGYKTHIFDPGQPPAAAVADQVTQATYSNMDAIAAFAQSCDVVTYEFENIPLRSVDHAQSFATVCPGIRALKVSQDRLSEKDFLTGLSIERTRYRDVPTLSTLEAALVDLGTPSILKTRRMGYDGKGQYVIQHADEAQIAFDAMKDAPAILEAFVKFDCEISVIIARGQDGAVVAFDPAENVHHEGILRTSTVPAQISKSQRDTAVLIAGQIVTALGYVGVMGVEFFVSGDKLLVNEIAPRVHNSGHWTQLGCTVDQFEQHIRAIAGLPLGNGTRHVDVQMENLIGDDIAKVPALLKDHTARVELYGKTETRRGRKMGHVNRVQARAR